MAYVSDKRLWLTEDKGTVVEDGDPRARFLLVAEGGELSDEIAAQYKLPKGKAAPAADEAKPAKETQAEAPAAPAEGKAVQSPPHTKAVQGPKGSK